MSLPRCSQYDNRNLYRYGEHAQQLALLLHHVNDNCSVSGLCRVAACKELMYTISPRLQHIPFSAWASFPLHQPKSPRPKRNAGDVSKQASTTSSALLFDGNGRHRSPDKSAPASPIAFLLAFRMSGLFRRFVSFTELMILAPGVSAYALVSPPIRRLQSDELATVQLFKENTPSVVYITNLAARRDAFTLDVMEVPQGSGSGFLWDKKGHVVTNYHVIRGASDLRVTLGDQSVYEADVVGYDEDKDVAVLHIDVSKDKLRPIPVGTSSNLLVGQKVYAIGNPFGLDHTLTTGVISGLRREISSAATGRPIQDVIQTDAAINPGNSGGPLLDSSGNLIGINTAIYSPSGASSGVGFSIPVDTVSGIVDQIIKYGKVTRPVLGISFAPEQSVEQLGVSGVLVLDAPPGGPAGKAGLRPTSRDEYGRLVLGDIITSLNGQKVSNGSDLYKILDRCKVGDQVTVEVLRGDKKVDVPVTLEARD
ncbi:hypothetical protein GOP47_0004815 [Adiantum capillus-veneris]|uniref:PDZ domain-containing protein n=1 Tax=Adiantum capillus-veneris TaxID=13818 RepID=A0A9D4V3Z6_ADICA|nr:hypothetical protein GOP47_0004815 [Adiantum capillus-veneris]